LVRLWLRPTISPATEDAVEWPRGYSMFKRPMRPDRVEMIRQTAEALARDEKGRSMADESESFADYQAYIAWSLYDALGKLWPDTMIAEVQAGLDGAEKVCRVEFER